MLDIDNGARFETYAIVGERGQICLNGAAARLVAPGDKVIIITYADYERGGARDLRAAGRPRRRAQPGDRRGLGSPRRRAHADRTGVTGRRPGRDPSTSWSWAAGWPGCRRRCGWPAPCAVAHRSLGVLTKGELSQSAHAVGPGRRRRRARAATRTHRPPSGRHAGGRGRACATRRRCASWSTRGPGRVARADRARASSSTARPAGCWRSPAREGTPARVVHAGGAATGAEVERALVDATYSSASAVLEGWFALDLLIEGGRCVGRAALPPGGAARTRWRCGPTTWCWPRAGPASSSRSPPTPPSPPATASPWRCGPGVPTADVEFVQFHPTALHHPAMPRPLLSEALRGHGALLRDRDGERFVDELAPRDVVSRAMAARMAEQGVEHLWLDATGLERFSQRFPTIAASLSSIGLDPQRDWLPIAPAAHHLSGGVVTDLVGGHRAARAVGGGRGGLHRRARGQPAGLQLAARGHGLRGPPGRAHRRRAAGDPSPAARCGRCSATSRSTASDAPGARAAPAVGPTAAPATADRTST